MVKLHLGCGKYNLPGFVHIDLADYPHVDHVHDVRTLPMIGDGACELVYASHLLEYFDRLEAIDVLREWHRVLMLGGTLRLSVPDFGVLANIYARTGDLSAVIGPLYGRIAGPLYHRTVYDWISLSVLLRSTGFHAIRRWVSDVVDDCSQTRLSLNVEADKC